MRRLIFILLFVMLAFQSAWAAAARYCQHETGAAARHVGHHEHQHAGAQTDSGAEQKSTASGAGGVDSDCSICHLSAAPSLACCDVIHPTLPEDAPQFAYHRSDLSHVPAGPERPDRLLA